MLLQQQAVRLVGAALLRAQARGNANAQRATRACALPHFISFSLWIAHALLRCLPACREGNREGCVQAALPQMRALRALQLALPQCPAATLTRGLSSSNVSNVAAQLLKPMTQVGGVLRVRSRPRRACVCTRAGVCAAGWC